jgi:hypothetical protein
MDDNQTQVTVSEDKTKGLIEELGLEGLSEDEKNDLMTTWAETIQDRVTLRILDAMTFEEQEEFNKLTESDSSDEDKDRFLAQHVPELSYIIEEEFTKFRSEKMVENQQIRQTLDGMKDQFNQNEQTNTEENQ